MWGSIERGEGGREGRIKGKRERRKEGGNYENQMARKVVIGEHVPNQMFEREKQKDQVFNINF